MGYDYNEQEIRDRVHSGKDAKRAASADALYNQATQPPHEDDYAAYQKLAALSGVSDPNQGFATMDAKNYGRMLLDKMGGGTQFDTSYGKAHDGGGFKASLGGVMTKLAPLSMLIPGVGMAGAGLIAAGVNSGGSLLKGDGLDLGGSLKDALIAGAGNAALGNGLGSGSSKLFGANSPMPDPGDIGGMGSQGFTPTGKPYQPGDGAAFNESYHDALSQAAPHAPTSGLLNQVKSQFVDPKTGKINFGQIGSIAGKGMEIYGANKTRQANERLGNAQLRMNERGMGLAEQNYAARQPMRDMAMKKLSQIGAKGSGSTIFGGGY